MSKRTPLLSSLEESLSERLLAVARAELEKGRTDVDAIEDEVFGTMEPAMLESLPAQLLKMFAEKAPQMLTERRTADRGFERRNFKRWQKTFDVLEIMLSIAEEVGEACGIEEWESAQAEGDYRFEALSQLFPRAILIVREIICLLKGGYPDAALSRWRSLHELTVTAIFISQNENVIALRYLANFDFQAYRAAKQYNVYAARGNLTPFSEDELAEIEQRRATAVEIIGGEIKGDWGWAAPLFKKDTPTFADIEKAVQMDHWRPRYKWASQHVHSGHRPASNLLGACEAKQPVMLVGQSNSGFVDPMHMAAISLWQIASTVLLRKANVDRVVYTKILESLAEDVGNLAVECASSTSRNFKK
jgi:hypothetical protein